MEIAFKILKTAAFPLRGYHLNRFYLVRTILNLVLSKLKPNSIIVDGNRMILDKYDSMRLSILGIYEPLAVERFQNMVKAGDVVLDIGAHIGYYTLMAAKRVGKQGKVYAFEPSRENCNLLTKNLKINGFKNVILVNKAIADTSKKSKLFMSRVSTGMHSLIDLDDNSENATVIDTISLNDFFGKNPPNISVIKMDIEGGEYMAFEGMTKILKRKHLSIFVEFSPFSIKKSHKSPRGFLNFLRSFGFKLYSFDETRKIILPIERISKFLASCPVDRDWHINLLATK